MTRPDASMTLLREVMDHPLDPGYAQRPAGSRRRPVWIGVAVLLGAVMGAGIMGQRDAQNPGAQLRAHVVHVDQQVGVQQDRLAHLSAEVAALQQTTANQDGLAPEHLRSLQLATGSTPVTGQGLAITLTNAPAGRADGQLTDGDLQSVVNAGWDAGAEAISVNGQRIGASTAIRAAGEAILVNFRPLAPPYRVELIADPKTLLAGYETGTAADYLQLLRQVGITVYLSQEGELHLPALAAPTLHHAKGTPR